MSLVTIGLAFAAVGGFGAYTNFESALQEFYYRPLTARQLQIRLSAVPACTAAFSGKNFAELDKGVDLQGPLGLVSDLDITNLRTAPSPAKNTFNLLATLRGARTATVIPIHHASNGNCSSLAAQDLNTSSASKGRSF